MGLDTSGERTGVREAVRKLLEKDREPGALKDLQACQSVFAGIPSEVQQW